MIRTQDQADQERISDSLARYAAGLRASEATAAGSPTTRFAARAKVIGAQAAIAELKAMRPVCHRSRDGRPDGHAAHVAAGRPVIVLMGFSDLVIGALPIGAKLPEGWTEERVLGWGERVEQAATEMAETGRQGGVCYRYW